MNADTSLSVSEINNLVKDVVDAGFPRALWVCGEIQNLDRYKSKAHLFFDLVEKAPGSGDIRAKAGITIWAGTRAKIEALLKRAENAFELKDGIEVRFLVKVDYYPAYGTLRLIVENIDPVHTLGKIAQERQRLIEELSRTGVLLKNKELDLPLVPMRLGLITAFDSAAYNDFVDELKKSGYSFSILVVNAVMQGKNAEASICAAIRCLDKIEGLDAVVITRGGGSIAELSCFDSKAIATAIADSRYPVITGIGHEINTSIADMAAHTFAKTPTAVAQFLVAKARVFLEDLREREVFLVEKAENTLIDKKAGLKESAMRLRDHARAFFRFHEDHLSRCSQELASTSLLRINDGQKELARSAEDLKKTIRLRLDRGRTTITALEKMTELASPQKLLKRGFSITRTANGRVIRSAADIKEGQALVTELAVGSIRSVVKT
jgi:exodeoxyribonuclease VII large subunit